ncbi:MULTISPECIES: AAA family ATPase [Acinetobacter]|mgnify:CR=1 FL=1|jgi:SpoVK/Ycf46/Vps4 family AAA+-type ATPase|uniref:AAA family ATPase n=5 Tax=Acinetobacter calcoaceticus/baumannii complex TaxID=909768 RepID=A0A2G1TQE0_ACIBA|nr:MULTISPECIES: AAA family ATPase [Acinetobacter]DAL28596.1 MAG TPA_asm: ATPase [Caudoviricetes sp.]AMM27135.1 AAA family ATPase [Acinetobacter pittii]ANC36548.1 AAA family ATPase [Acinetobacter baumannii]AXX42604.1 AAA family ATPase [Acinetobacter baumannii]EHU1238328.1 AAA family ATPase [Acinetobacter baumannii]
MELKLSQLLIDSALTGNVRSVEMALKKIAPKIKSDDPELYHFINSRLQSNLLRSKDNSKILPVDTDSRLQLVRVENPVIMSSIPILSESIESKLFQVVKERSLIEKLLELGLAPTKTILFEGPPGVGKTMSARWLANKLELPLIVLDLATVISSYLGKTGSNIRAVLDYASSFPCVMLLDEFDAIAKRRDDERELGELKRLVTVLLQTLDDWPESSILIAATNHSELLDPAIWRRFDLQLKFSNPTPQMIEAYIEQQHSDLKKHKKLLCELFSGKSFSDIERTFNLSRKEAFIKDQALINILLGRNENLKSVSNASQKQTSKTERNEIVLNLYRKGLSQRKIAEETGLSRPTIKKIITTLQTIESN